MILRISLTVLSILTVSIANETIPHGDVDKQCNTLCPNSRSEYSKETHICRCFLNKNIDSIELINMNKNANLRRLSLEIITPDGGFILIKPKVTEITPTTNQPITTTLNDDFEKITALQPPTHQSHHHKTVQPITTDRQRLLLDQIRDRLNRLSIATDQRRRQSELHGIRASLRQLSHTTLQPTQKRAGIGLDSLKNRMEQARMQTKLGRLGAAAPNLDNHTITVEAATVQTASTELGE